MLRLLFLLLFSTHLFSQNNEFDQLMGVHDSRKNYLQTSEDFENYSFFQRRFEQTLDQLNGSIQRTSIPKKIHFIYLGNNSFPKIFEKNMLSWKKYHPDWEIFLWSDKKRSSLSSRIHQVVFENSYMETVEDLFQNSSNIVEKTSILSYCILLKEGGVFVDIDYEANCPFLDFCCSKADFITLVDLPHEPVLSSSISTVASFIASMPGHSILKETIALMEKNWQMFSEQFFQDSEESGIYRAVYRSFFPFDEAVKSFSNDQRGFLSFPITYFRKEIGKILRDKSIKEKWLKFPRNEIDNVFINLKDVSEKIRTLSFLMQSITFLSFLLFVWSLFLFFSKKKRVQ